MSQETYIELGKLIKTLEQELLNSSLKVQSAELELKVVVHQENGEMRIHILDSGTEADWKNLHTLKVKVRQEGSAEPPGGSGSRLRRDTDDASGPGEPPGGSGLGKPPGVFGDPGKPPGGSGGSGEPSGGSGG